MFDGALLFALKDTHGLPLGFALDRIINDEGMRVDWAAFIDAAREAGWWDFQTHTELMHGMQDAGLPKETQAAILDRFKLYVLKRPHKALGFSSTEVAG